MAQVRAVGPSRLADGLAWAGSRRGPDETTHTETLTPGLRFLRYISDTPVDADEVRRIAKLARVDPDEGEVEEFATRLTDILGYSDALDEVSEVDHKDEPVNVMRPDEVRDGLTQEEVLSNAIETKDGFFRGPRVSQTSLNAFIAKETLNGSDNGPLAGKSVAVKDSISTEGLRTTCGSAMLKDYVPPYDATVIELLKDASATIVGEVSMDEFGMGTTTGTSTFGPTKNPVDEFRVSGGSSDDSTTVVTAGKAGLALGTDTDGSIRCPAAFCSVVGIKPTYGLVSRYGLIAYANSLEQIGPIAPTVKGTATLLDVIAGPDDQDGTTRDAGVNSNYTAAADGDVEGLIIGIPTEFVKGADEGVEEAFWITLDELKAQGTEYREISMPSVEKAVVAYYVVAMSEASSSPAHFDGVRYDKSGGYDGSWNEAFARAHEGGSGSEVGRRILLGTYALSAGYRGEYYAKVQNARAWVKQDFNEVFEDVGVIASPTMPVPPFELGESLDDLLQACLADADTVPVNLASLPAIPVPADETDDPPVDLQLIGPEFGEKTIVRATSAVED